MLLIEVVMRKKDLVYTSFISLKAGSRNFSVRLDVLIIGTAKDLQHLGLTEESIKVMRQYYPLEAQFLFLQFFMTVKNNLKANEPEITLLLLIDQ